METSVPASTEGQLTFWAALRMSAVEVGSGLVMIIGGGVVAGISDGAVAKTIGAVLVAVGGLLVSYKATSVLARDQAQRELAGRLSLFSNQLRATAAQLVDTVGDAQADRLEKDTCYALMLQSSQTLTELLGQMRATFGIGTDGKDMAGARKEVMALVQDFRAAAAEAKSVAHREGREDEADRFADLEVAASAVEERLIERVRAPASVACPHCAKPVEALVGTSSGESALPTCPHCNELFHLHRARDGSVFARRRGGTEAPQRGNERREEVLECTSCGTTVTARLGLQPGSTAWIVCPSCTARFPVHRDKDGEAFVSPARSTHTAT